MVFETKGMKNGMITLPGFDKEVQIGDLNYLRFDGLVADIEEHTTRLCHEFRLPNKFDKGTRISGRTVTISYMDFIGSIIFYKDLGEVHNIFTLGHESAEALIDYGMGQTIVRFFRDAGFCVSDDFRRTERETFCDLSGLLALHLKGRLNDFIGKFPYRVDPLIVVSMMQSYRR